MERRLAAAVAAQFAAVDDFLRCLSAEYFVGLAHFTFGTGWKKAPIQKHCVETTSARKEMPTMVPKRGQVPFLLESSSLEVEPLEIFVNVPEPEQANSLDTLTTQGDVEVAALWTGMSPTNDSCCCCCCPTCCCC